MDFIDAHAEALVATITGARSETKSILRPGAQFVSHARVIAHRVHAAVIQHGGHFFHAFARAAVDDAALPLMFGQKTAQFRVAVFGSAHLQKEVGAVESGQDIIGILQFEQPDDIRADGLRRRRGKLR